MLAYVLMSLVEVHRNVFLCDILSLDEVTEPTFRHRVPVCVIPVSSISVVLFLIQVSFLQLLLIGRRSRVGFSAGPQQGL